ncbi:hypothetical protein IY145_18000 [Methylosinus sp. H3A]|uniref:hypothetical protein n=1 Tax=Methylosinus sp. H3A TaxID=2785786 RepID=UPI0018C21045|nr:hypothetical protein [Methylosinus sp. H3A]MBG0811248.1 hypothetical protein [Methylosinus sp. H3A]
MIIIFLLDTQLRDRVWQRREDNIGEEAPIEPFGTFAEKIRHVAFHFFFLGADLSFVRRIT